MKLGTVEHIFRVEDAPSTTELSLSPDLGI